MFAFKTKNSDGLISKFSCGKVKYQNGDVIYCITVRSLFLISTLSPPSFVVLRESTKYKLVESELYLSESSFNSLIGLMSYVKNQPIGENVINQNTEK